jgi:Domain of unknown function (DUF6456)
MDKPQKPPETLGSVPLNGGISSAGKVFGGSLVNGKFVPNSTGELVRECGPDGAIVEHRVRKSAYVHERLHSAKKLDHELYDAAEKFRLDFERAQLVGNYARLDLHKTRAGKQDMSDSAAAAKGRIANALEALGKGKDRPSLSQSCVWNTVGLGMTMEAWTQLVKQNGASMNADKASGVFHVCLERLALHYGMIDVGRVAAIRQEGAYGRGIKDFFEFADVFAVTAQGGEKNVIGKFIAAAQKRFGRFA